MLTEGAVTLFVEGIGLPGTPRAANDLEGLDVGVTDAADAPEGE